MEMPEIQHYCTVRRSELTDTADGLLCSRCMKTLTDLEDPAAVAKARKSGTLTCGFVRRMAIPALASSLGLSSCAGTKPTEIMMGEPTYISKESVSKGAPEKPHSSDEITGGVIAVDQPKKEDHPIAKRVEGQEHQVISPYTGKKVDVSNIPPGKLALDPTVEGEHKVFRVPK